MSLLHAFLLALVQGVTEFLPISSSAHLILMPRLMGWRDQGLVFDIVTHVGTLTAVIVFFRHELRELLAAVPRLFKAEGWRQGDPGFLLAALGVGTIPVAVAGLLLHDWVATAGRNALLIATTSIGFGLLLGWADWRPNAGRSFADVGWRDALVIGGFQALALIPGTSRSGITITAALLLGLSRPAAARFSFLLSIPVGLLVGAKDALDLFHTPGPVDWLPLILAFTVSALAAFAVIVALLAWLERQSLQLFVAYRVLLGVVIFAWFLG